MSLTEWGTDVGTPSTFTGTISGATGSPLLTLGGAATGPMWEGEVLGCAPYSQTCPFLGVYIQSLASGTWGASGSTYNLAIPTNSLCVSSTCNVASQAMTYPAGLVEPEFWTTMSLNGPTK